MQLTTGHRRYSTPTSNRSPPFCQILPWIQTITIHDRLGRAPRHRGAAPVQRHHPPTIHSTCDRGPKHGRVHQGFARDRDVLGRNVSRDANGVESCCACGVGRCWGRILVRLWRSCGTDCECQPWFWCWCWALGDGSDLAPRLVFLILAAERLNPVSKAYYHETRAARLGERWTTLRVACSASPEDRAEKVGQGIEAIRGVWRKVAALYDREGDSEGGSFVLGAEPCFLDFAVAGRIKFIFDVLTPAEAETLTNFKLEGGSKLGRLVESLERHYKY